MRLIMLVLIGVFATSLNAKDLLPTSTENPVLTIKANGQTYELDADDLRTLPSKSFTTTTIWTDGPQAFLGIPTDELLKLLGATDGVLRLTAANGYVIDVPIEHYGQTTSIIAYERNGNPMTLRDKGPLWLVYPFDSDPAYKSEIIYANSIWQLERIEVKD